MVFTEQDLDTLSKLSRIDINEGEKAKMLADMQAILGYVSEINEIDATPSAHQESEENLVNVVREDVVIHDSGVNTEAILSNAPHSKDGYVEVMQVLK